MGIVRDVAIIGALIGATIIFRDRIGQAFAETGEVLGGGLAGGFQSFLDSLSGGFTGAGLPDIPDLPSGPTGPPAPSPVQPPIDAPPTSPFTACQCCTTQISKNLCENTLGLFSCPCEGAPPPSFDILPEAFGEPRPPVQGPIQVPEIIPTIEGGTVRILPETRPVETIPTFTPEVTSQLPTEQVFGGGGPSFIGGTVREDPVDTLREVLDLFPQLTAGQASDFLRENRGISPSDALRLDPDIQNITANIAGVNIPAGNIGIPELEREEFKAAQTSCNLFGLNCELVGMA